MVEQRSDRGWVAPARRTTRRTVVLMRRTLRIALRALLRVLSRRPLLRCADARCSYSGGEFAVVGGNFGPYGGRDVAVRDADGIHLDVAGTAIATKSSATNCATADAPHLQGHYPWHPPTEVSSSVDESSTRILRATRASCLGLSRSSSTLPLADRCVWAS